MIKLRRLLEVKDFIKKATERYTNTKESQLAKNPA
jgi:hypothetical protein